MSDFSSGWQLMSGSSTMYVLLEADFYSTSARYTFFFSTTGSKENLFTSSQGRLSCNIGSTTVTNQTVSGGQQSFSNILPYNGSWPNATNIKFEWKQLSVVFNRTATLSLITVDGGGGGGGDVPEVNDNEPFIDQVIHTAYMKDTSHAYVQMDFKIRLYDSQGQEDTTNKMWFENRRIGTDGVNAQFTQTIPSSAGSRLSGTDFRFVLNDNNYTFTAGKSYRYYFSLRQPNPNATGHPEGYIKIYDVIDSVTMQQIPMRTAGSTYQISSSVSTLNGGEPYAPTGDIRDIITYSSSNSSKISVNNKGLITFNATGSATITVTYTQYFAEIGVTVTKSASQIVTCGSGFPYFEDTYRYLNNGLCVNIMLAQNNLAGRLSLSLPVDLSAIIKDGTKCTYVNDVYILMQSIIDNTRFLYFKAKGYYPSNIPDTFPKFNRQGNSSWYNIVNNIIDILQELDEDI